MNNNDSDLEGDDPHVCYVTTVGDARLWGVRAVEVLGLGHVAVVTEVGDVPATDIPTVVLQY